MPVAIQPFSGEFIPAVKQFNARLLEGGVFHEFQFHESPLCSWLPKTAGRRIFQEYFIAAEDGAVRGGYVLKHQPFSFAGEVRNLAFFHAPISEGLFNKKYASVGAVLTRHAVQAQPQLFALGMGGWQQPLPRMLVAMRWKCFEVPFYFRVCKPFAFLRQIQPLRATRAKAFAVDAAAWSGAGWIGLRAWQAVRGSAARRARGTSAVTDSDFGDWADVLWDACHAQYALIGLRDRETLRILYPPGDSRFHRLVIRRGSAVLGWAVVLDSAMKDHKYFGNLRVGSIVDCLADVSSAGAVIARAALYLEQRGVDLIVSNQSHEAWGEALRGSGFLNGPSNFLFAASPKLAERLEPFETVRGKLHFTRGDGDGPIHL